MFFLLYKRAFKNYLFIFVYVKQSKIVLTIVNEQLKKDLIFQCSIVVDNSWIYEPNGLVI